MFVEPGCGFVCLISKGVGLFVGKNLGLNLFVCGDRDQVFLFVFVFVFEPVCEFVCLWTQGVGLFVEPGCGNFACQPVDLFTFKLGRGYACLLSHVRVFVCCGPRVLVCLMWSQGVSIFVCEAREFVHLWGRVYMSWFNSWIFIFHAYNDYLRKIVIHGNKVYFVPATMSNINSILKLYMYVNACTSFCVNKSLL